MNQTAGTQDFAMNVATELPYLRRYARALTGTQTSGDNYAAATLEQAEGYRAEAVNNAQGEASRFNSIYEEYVKAPEVTRRRMYLETMEKVLGDVDKVILDDGTTEGGSGVVPYLPLDQLRRSQGSGGDSGNADNTNRNSL